MREKRKRQISLYGVWRFLSRLLIIHIVDIETKHLQAFPTALFPQRRQAAALCRFGRTGKTSGGIQGWRQLPVFVVLRVTRSTGKRQGLMHALQVFLPMTISNNKGIDYDRQKTGNKSGEQTRPFFFPIQLSVQPKRKTAATVSLFE
jgi:hypothetical protein